MKALKNTGWFLLAVMAASSGRAEESTFYQCASVEEGNSATLSVRADGTVHWEEPWHSAESDGNPLGALEAPASPWKGFLQFHLTSFYTTNDALWVLALEASREHEFRAVTFFDDDDHFEEETEYRCMLWTSTSRNP